MREVMVTVRQGSVSAVNGGSSLESVPSFRSRPTSQSHSSSTTASLPPSPLIPLGRLSQPDPRRGVGGGGGGAGLPNVGRRLAEVDASGCCAGEGKGIMRSMGGSCTATRRSDGVTQTLRRQSRWYDQGRLRESRSRRTSLHRPQCPFRARPRRGGRSPRGPAPLRDPLATPRRPCPRREGRTPRWSAVDSSSLRLRARSSTGGGGPTRS